MLIFLSMMIFSSYSSDPLVLYTIIVGPNGLDIFEPASLNNLKVGDVLIFNFNSSGHNVRETNGDSCNYNSNGKFIFSINKKIWVKKKNHIIFKTIQQISFTFHSNIKFYRICISCITRRWCSRNQIWVDHR